MTLYDSQGDYIIGPVLTLSTRKGRQIPNEQRMPRPPLSMEAARDIVLTNHPSARVRSLSSMYNCVGMAFAARRTWVEPEQLDMILNDDDYRRVAHEEELTAGDIVIYRDDQQTITHVGVVIQVQINLPQATRDVLVLSQWGRDGEFFHSANDVNPLLGSPVEYWTDRI